MLTVLPSLGSDTFGTARYNAILASVNFGHLFQVVSSYWLLHHSHHTKLGLLPLLEARERARRGHNLGIVTRLFSPPARKYSLIVDRDGTVLPRQSEVLHQALSVLVHAIAPVAFAGYAVAALRADNGTDRALQTSLVAQALASVAGYLAIVVYFSGLVQTSRTVFGIGSNLLNKLCCVALITQDLGGHTAAACTSRRAGWLLRCIDVASYAAGRRVRSW